MQALRELCQQYRKWQSLEDYISRIETFSDNGPIIIDNCKCIIEVVCKTILEDIGLAPVDHEQQFHLLVRQTTEKLDSINNKSPDLVAAFTNTAQKIAEVRNKYTVTGHGQSVRATEENRQKVTNADISFLISIIEQTAIYLITIYQDEYPEHIQSNLRYEDNPDFNQELDGKYDPVQIGRYGPYNPSEVLFNVDKNAYRTELNLS